MKLLLIIIKFLYLVFPPFAIIYLAYKLEKYTLLLAILTAFVGVLSRVYKYHGIPLFYFIMLLYLFYAGFNVYNLFNFMGIWLFWGYFLAGFAAKIKQLNSPDNDFEYQYQ